MYFYKGSQRKSICDRKNIVMTHNTSGNTFLCTINHKLMFPTQFFSTGTARSRMLAHLSFLNSFSRTASPSSQCEALISYHVYTQRKDAENTTGHEWQSHCILSAAAMCWSSKINHSFVGCTAAWEISSAVRAGSDDVFRIKSPCFALRRKFRNSEIRIPLAPPQSRGILKRWGCAPVWSRAALPAVLHLGNWGQFHHLAGNLWHPRLTR